MHSSTSNSNDRIPDLRWGARWFAVVFVVFIVVLCWNIQAHKSGGYLTTNDSADLWAHRRGKISGDKNIVFLGSSRTLTGIDLAAAESKTGKRPIQLAIGGASPLPALKHLAEDESFKGIVVSDFEEAIVYPTDLASDSPNRIIPIQGIEKSIERFNNLRMDEAIEFRLRLYSQYLVASPMSPDTPANMIHDYFSSERSNESIIERGSAGRIRVRFDRSLEFDSSTFPSGTIERLKALQKRVFLAQIKNLNPDPVQFRGLVDRLESYVKRIQQRGGRVVFVTYPKNGEIWEINQRGYPRTKFWRILNDRTSALVIHFKDYEALSQFECPDGSHLDSKDAPAFTRALIDIINGQLPVE